MKTEPIHRTSMWKFKLSAATMTLIPAAVGINYVAKSLAEGLKLPVWLGSLGTFLSSMLADELKEAHTNLPTSYLQHLVVSNFIETLTWWLKKGQDFTYQEVVQFYLDLLIPKN